MATKNKSAPKPKADPTKKLLITAIKKTVNHNTVLPILEDVFLSGKEAIFTDLENVVIFPFEAEGVNACIYSKSFIDILQMMDAPEFTQEDDFKVTAQEGKRQIKLHGEDPNNFPRNPEIGKPIGNWGLAEIGHLKDVLPFTSNDDLRPAMTGVLCADNIVATDAHRMVWFPINKLKQEILLPSKGVEILIGLGGEKWQVLATEHHATFINEFGVTLITRIIDARYPDYKVVIPADDGILATMILDKEPVLKEIQNALKFTNRTTKMVTFNMNGKINLSGNDVDFDMQYSNELEGQVKFRVKENETPSPLTVAFNGAFLIEIIEKVPKGEKVTIKLWGAQKAAIINDHYLLMPLMLNS